MGVETIMRDRFQAAREYADRGMQTETGRKNLELQALAEILAPAGLTPAVLKAEGRYVEDVY